VDSDQKNVETRYSDLMADPYVQKIAGQAIKNEE
jgi:hypothetical protein